ncbi:MAG: patatin-like phospholipase family protein [Gemmatimonadaceae bacterium]
MLGEPELARLPGYSLGVRRLAAPVPRTTFGSVPAASSLTLRAGPDALRLIRARGLRADDVDIVPGASGGAKWLTLGGLDRFLFGDFLQQPRARPLHLIGSSIGSWRLACLGQQNPVAALARGHRGYIYDQEYSRRPTTTEITAASARILDDLLGETGVAEILAHPTMRLHVLTAEGRGFAASENRLALTASLALAAASNVFQRRALSAQFRRTVFHSSGAGTPFSHLSDLPTRHIDLTSANLRDVLLASGSIPLLLDGVRIGGAGNGMFWDGGVLDYHLDIDFGAGDGLVLYPHFYDHIVPGWFDKSLPWRRAGAANFRRVLLVAPSAEFVQALPGGKIPDRKDFYRLPHAERIKRWQATLDEGARLGDELRELIATGAIAGRVRPW